QAEDGIRDLTVTGVQTCALPICGRPRDGPPADSRKLAVIRAAGRRGAGPRRPRRVLNSSQGGGLVELRGRTAVVTGGASGIGREIGRASCRERVEWSGEAGWLPR